MKITSLNTLPALTIALLVFSHTSIAGGSDCKYIIDNQGKHNLTGIANMKEGDEIRVDGKNYSDKDKDYTYQVPPGKKIEVKANGDHKCGLAGSVFADGDVNNTNVSSIGYKRKSAGEGGEVDCEIEKYQKGDFQAEYNCECDGNVNKKKHYARVTITCK